MASRNLGTLTLDLVTKIGGFTAPMDKAARHAEDKSKEIQKSFLEIKKTALSVGASLGVAFSVASFNNWIRGSVNAANATKDFADRIGVTTEELTSLRYVANEFGVSSDAFDVALQRYTRRSAEAANGFGIAAKSIKQLGLDAKELVKLPIDRQLQIIADRLKNIGDHGSKMSIIKDLFDTGGMPLINMLNAGSDSMKEAAKDAEKLGYVLSSEVAQQAADVNRRIEVIGQSFGNISTVIAAEFLPNVESFLKSITSDDIKGFTDSLVVGINHAVTAFKALTLIVAGRYIGVMGAAAAVTIKNTVELARYNLTLGAMSGQSALAVSGISAITAATTGLSRALALVGGPLGLIAIAAGSLFLFSSRSSEASGSVKSLITEIKELGNSYENLTQKQAKAYSVELTQEQKRLNKGIAEGEKELQKMEDKINDLIRIQKDWAAAGDPVWVEKYGIQIAQLQDKYAIADRAVEKHKEELSEVVQILGNLQAAITGAINAEGALLNESSTKFQEMADRLIERNKLIGVTSEAGRLSIELEKKEYSDLTEEHKKELIALAEANDAKSKAFQESQKRIKTTKSSMKKRNDLDIKYKSILEELKTAEQKYTEDLKEKLSIMQKMGATEEQMLLLRQRKLESVRTEVPSLTGGLDFGISEFASLTESKNELDKWREEELAKVEATYTLENELIAAGLEERERIEQEYRQRKMDYDDAMKSTTLGFMSDSASQTADMLKSLVGESSAAYKAMFAVSKGAAAAEAIVNAEVASVKALAYVPFPANIGISNMIKAMGYVNAATIAATGIKGMAHSGLDKVPETGTWLLQKGERVVTENTSAKLDQTLEQVRKGTSKSSINVEIINNASGVRHEVEQISEGRIRIIAQEEVARGAAEVVAKDLRRSANSTTSKAMNASFKIQRNR